MYDANKNELEILRYWDEHHCFEKSVSERPEKKPYVFYDGPPFATGLPHYGHILGSVIKDVVPRYWTMKGWRVRRRWGWDCHGLPIENLVEKELCLSGKKEIEEKIGVGKFNAACRSRVLTYTREWKKMVERIGRWIEFDNAYKTMDSTYMESVWWALKTVWDKGLIYEGRKVLMYCPRCETPVSKAEVAMDESYKDITEEAVTVKFKVKSEKLKVKSIDGTVYILAWTTTPWTLPGNVALAVGESIRYQVVSIKGEEGLYVVALNRAGEVLKGKDYEVVEELNGADLVGWEYEPLFEIPAVKESGKKAWYVAPADFVTTEEGTGVVHTAVIYGEDDYNLGVKIDLPMVPLLDEKGIFNERAPALIRGQYFKQAEKVIKDDLEKRGLLFARENHTHSYPHCWRCDTQLFYNAISAWFINIQKIKKRLIKLNEKINWYPEHLKRGRFLNILETAPDWNISRNRYWATPLPFWKCTGAQATANHPYPSLERRGGEASPPARGGVSADEADGVVGAEGCGEVVCVGSVEELKKKAVNFSEVYPSDDLAEMDLHKDQMDKIKLRCEQCGGEMTRVPEVIDCWVESASMPFAEWHYPFENKKVFEERFPGQYIGEYIGQVRAWFYYMHVMAALLFDDISFENCVVTGNMLNEKGEKLSKSKRNFTDPWIIIEQYGMDALRYYLMTSVVMQADDLFFSDREVREVYNKVINILWNVVEFYKMYANCHPRESGDPDTRRLDSRLHGNDSTNVLDKWILAKLNLLVKEATEQMDNYNTVKAGRPIKDFIDDLSTWYVRRSRDRFKGDDVEDKNQAIATLREALLTLSKVMAPFTPFIAEKVYQMFRTTDYGLQTTDLKESVHLEEWPAFAKASAGKAKESAKILTDMAAARKIVEMGLALRAEAGIKVRQPLAKLTISNEQLTNELLSVVADELNVKSVEVVKNVESVSNVVVKEDGGLKVGLDVEVTPELKKEGWAREVVRAINQLRKEQKLTISDSVTVEYAGGDELLSAALSEFSEEIKKGVLAKELKSGAADGGAEAEIDGVKLKLLVRKAG